MQIRGEALTADGARVMRRLCRHWGHKFTVEFDDTNGVIHLNDTRLTMQVLPERLTLLLEHADEVPARLPGVVTEHLQRMAGTDPALVVHWSDPVPPRLTVSGPPCAQ